MIEVIGIISIALTICIVAYALFVLPNINRDKIQKSLAQSGKSARRIKYNWFNGKVAGPFSSVYDVEIVESESVVSRLCVVPICGDVQWISSHP